MVRGPHWGRRARMPRGGCQGDLGSVPAGLGGCEGLTLQRRWRADMATAVTAALVAPGTLLVEAAQVQARACLPGDGAHSHSACKIITQLGTSGLGHLTMAHSRAATYGSGEAGRPGFSPPGMSMQMWPQPMPVHRCPRGHCASAWHSSTHRSSALSPLSAGAPSCCHLAVLEGLGLGPAAPEQAVPSTSGHSHALPATAGVTALLLSLADAVIQALPPAPAPYVPARLCPGALPRVLCQRRGPG